MRYNFFLLIVLVVFIGCEHSPPKPVVEDMQQLISEEEGLQVSAIPVVFGNFPLQMPVNGTIHATKKASLHFATSGTIQSIGVRNGDEVEKGQLLATLEDVRQQNQMALANETFNSARTELQSILLGYSNGLGYDTTTIDPELLSNLKTQAGYNAAVLQVEQASLALNDTKLFAPFTGRIAGISTQAFNHISAGEVFCTLINEEAFVVKFSIIETEIDRLKKATYVRVKPIINDNEWLIAELSEINFSVDRQGLMQVTAEIKKGYSNTGIRLVDGMNANVIVEELVPNQIIIPKQALVVRNNRDVVFTVENGQAKWNYVKIAYQNSSHLAIADGLSMNDSIVISGNLNLAHDARIKVVNKE
ncbi:MAG: efflux RND transporter periplasmic adaptor subunit [Bacteroidales bacterium]|jgi:RND family efflux transporter MFP subunit|nr:efflux RND transporter periplasmic adaptor subunit [Bacteroidales bacterium]MDD3702514.1 efflux RND transporter periplasmic adaptor subunit [Bacteroidales bacterium]MDY0369569.1 efflux RND transporter periplasmic adaptor subunit [Bacteroidales bacterium]